MSLWYLVYIYLFGWRLHTFCHNIRYMCIYCTTILLDWLLIPHSTQHSNRWPVYISSTAFFVLLPNISGGARILRKWKYVYLLNTFFCCNGKIFNVYKLSFSKYIFCIINYHGTFHNGSVLDTLFIIVIHKTKFCQFQSLFSGQNLSKLVHILLFN